MPTTTGRALVTRALKKLQVIGGGQTPNSNDMADGFAVLNSLLDGWKADKLTIYQVDEAEFSFVAGTASYTLGIGGTFNRVRPSFLRQVSIMIYTNPALPMELPIDVFDNQQWQAVSIKATPSRLPTGVHINFTFPLMILTYWPVPNDATVKTKLYCETPLDEFATLDTAYSLPPGYRRALEFNLAMEMAPDFEREPSQVVMQKSAEYLADIRGINAANIQSEIVPVDAALLSDRAHFNWRTGQ